MKELTCFRLKLKAIWARYYPCINSESAHLTRILTFTDNEAF